MGTNEYYPLPYTTMLFSLPSPRISKTQDLPLERDFILSEQTNIIRFPSDCICLCESQVLIRVSKISQSGLSN